MNNNVTLIIPTYRNPKYLDLCLKSAVENRDDDHNHIMVIVDGYLEENREVIDRYSLMGVLFLEFEENQGMQYALNAGVAQVSTKYVFVINDDNVMPRHWDTRLMNVIAGQAVRSDPGGRWYVMTVDQVEPTGPGMFKFPVHDLGQTVETFQYNEWLDYEESIAVEQEPLRMIQDGHIFPFVMEKKFYMALGGFDTFYNSPNVVDWDFFLKFELMQFEFPRTRRLRLYHFGSVSTKKNSESQQFKEREQAAFDEFTWKWGVRPYNGPNNTKIPPQGLRGIECH